MRAALFACLLLSACNSPTLLGGIQAVLRFGSTPAQCARVYATAQDELHQAQSTPIARASGDLPVAIAETDALGTSITLEAHGYANAACTGPWDDDSNVVSATFPEGSVETGIVLLLDGRPMTNPDAGSGEVCNNGVDDNHDGLTDCQDPHCDLQSCGAGGFYCLSGQCKNPGMEVNCSDQQDNDLNGLTDCADPACDGKTCRAGDLCTTFTCSNKTCAGTSVMCLSPSPCQQPGTGVCVPSDGGCSYTPKSSGACGTAGTCLNGDCVQTLPFVPSSGVPETLPDSQVGGALTLNCDTAFDTDSLTFKNLCSGQTAPPAWAMNGLAVLAMSGLTVGSNGSLTITGTRPLVLMVFGDATLAGHISADAVLDVPGAGAFSGCTVGVGGAGRVSSGAAGGGAGHSTIGGKGGDGPDGMSSGGAQGGVEADDTLQPLRGGCTGGAGSLPGGTGAAGGGGGGAFQLTVAGTLHVTSGKLSAAGGGGRGGLATAGGGGGGGSGGGIVLEATTVTLENSARILTNGGAGAGGASDTDVGDDGDNGHPTDTDNANGGRAGGDLGGNGGDGATRDNDASDGDSGGGDGSPINGLMSGGGGGGGGGLGRIVIAHGMCTQASSFHSAPDLPDAVCHQL